MVNAMEKSVESLPPNERVVPLADWASRVSLDIIGLAGMGQAFNAIPDPNNTLYKKYKSMFGESPARLRKVRLVLFILSAAKLYFRWYPSEYNRKLFDGSKYVRNFSRQIIQEKKEKMAKSEHVTTDIISVALESGCFTDEDLVDQVMTFLAAGHETTATALQWSAYALCMNPDIQKRLSEEIRSSLPRISDPNTPTITASQIDSLPYLNAFCNEVLRYYPPVRITVRQAARDTSLCDTFIPKGTYISIAPQALNRSTELWGPDANEFNPERWLKPGKAHNGGAENNYAFLTFLHGPRSCIGSTFAKGELACLVAALVNKFDIELEDPNMELKYSQELTTKPKGGIRLRIKEAR
jgi:cytochrome P450